MSETSSMDSVPEDLEYLNYVRKAIEAGLADDAAGRTIDVSEVRALLGLAP